MPGLAFVCRLSRSVSHTHETTGIECLGSYYDSGSAEQPRWLAGWLAGSDAPLTNGVINASEPTLRRSRCVLPLNEIYLLFHCWYLNKISLLRFGSGSGCGCG